MRTIELASAGRGVDRRPQGRPGAHPRALREPEVDDAQAGADQRLIQLRTGPEQARGDDTGVGRERDCRRASEPEAAVKLVGEQQVGQLGLGVRRGGLIAALGLEVVEVHHALFVALAAHGHDPRAGRLQQPVQHQPGQREMAEVVGGQGQLESVLGPLVGHLHDSGVVDEKVQARMARSDLLGGLAHRGERRKVEADDSSAGPAVSDFDAVGRLLRLIDVPAGEYY